MNESQLRLLTQSIISEAEALIAMPCLDRGPLLYIEDAVYIIDEVHRLQRELATTQDWLILATYPDIHIYGGEDSGWYIMSVTNDWYLGLDGKRYGEDIDDEVVRFPTMRDAFHAIAKKMEEGINDGMGIITRNSRRSRDL